ncbi:hypothetical protein C4K23_2601 [Pseudomonas chlororaphis]|nr:hypothetical protein C4K23_2601 [Pseudomonas chlororaphis]
MLFYSSEHNDAKQQVGQLISQLGFFGIDLDGLQQGQLAQFPGGSLPGLNLVKFG